MNISQLHKLFLSCKGVCTDTRKITPGVMFFALKGENFDGNDFAADALAAGAKYAVVSALPENAGEEFILVDDTLKTLRALAKYHREQFSIPVLGITGTNGKTTTKELVNAVLSTKFNTLCTEGNLNNHIGVPLTLLRLNSFHQIAVVEMGASHPGEIRDSVELAQLGFGLVTNVGAAHLEGFGSLEGVKKTKGELYDWVMDHNGVVFYNADNSILEDMVASRGLSKTVRYGVKEQGVRILPVSAEHPSLALILKDGTNIDTSLIGSYNADNVLAALSVGGYFGVDLNKAVKAIEDYTPSNSRSQLVKTADNVLIVDAYNANVASMTASLNNFAATSFPNKVLILGDMYELGAFSEQAHRDILAIAHKITDEVYLVGRGEFRKVATPSDKVFSSSAELKDYLSENKLCGKTILIKGSNSNKLGILKEAL
ncbi:MAG: UDP-N-acetylmuramoyl-tripeptide--D-alanyl-D-alanine ligase [Bacteroidales bacterium]|nr:UDP-N-acetylmuramoyl-tripeptide--D-alanyl-D-alanine ligase [Bacteroidales bacterium]